MKYLTTSVSIVSFVLAAVATGCVEAPAAHAREPVTSIVAPPNESVRFVASTSSHSPGEGSRLDRLRH
jgi:hypothetical protein